MRADLTAGLVGSLFALGFLALAVEVTLRPGSPYLLEQISLACSVLALSLAAVLPGRVHRSAGLVIFALPAARSWRRQAT